MSKKLLHLKHIKLTHTRYVITYWPTFGDSLICSCTYPASGNVFTRYLGPYGPQVAHRVYVCVEEVEVQLCLPFVPSRALRLTCTSILFRLVLLLLLLLLLMMMMLL